jgi:glycosyltransferase involved in cell wall biosynthesis
MPDAGNESENTEDMKEMRNSTTPIVVMLGVHRSGTSLSARILSDLGLRLGDQLLPGHRDNPEGFWEHAGIIAETREMENLLGINPFRGERLVPPSNIWWAEKPFADSFHRLKSVIQKETSKSGMFGFKDPRTLLLLPMWQAVFNELEVNPHYIVLMRHPAAVAGSINKRNGLSTKHGEFIWRNHLSFGLAHLESAPSAVIHYENWFHDLKSQLAAAARVLDYKGHDLDEIEKKVEVYIDPKKMHFQGHAGSNGLGKQTAELYESLATKSGGIQWDDVAEKARGIQADILSIGEIYESIAGRANRIDMRFNQCKTEIADLKERISQLASKTGGDSTAHEADLVEPRPLASTEAEFPELTRFMNSVDTPGQKLRVCIAAEDIVGPIRNGGIGTTYTHLSRLLAEAGHEVVVAYLRGNFCQNESIQHWIDWYKSFGVTFVPLDPNKVELDSSAPRWIRPMVALYSFLKEERFDLVHVSEWRGSAYLSLMARKQGLALADTFFCVKASSPWLWNREYGYHTIDRIDDLPKMFAEKRSIELADMVISGSRYLLRWMLDHGYKLPEGRCYVQPNVMVPLDLGDAATAFRRPGGKRIKIQEIVFFGRLEYRKGLDIFFDAIDRLVEEKVLLPKITLMGKYGDRIPSDPELTVPDYIKKRTRNLPFKVEVLTNFGNEEALRYLLGGQRLAVMPSRIENSTLCVYEAAYYRIPCIATDRGGTAELIKPNHRKEVLTEPLPNPLAEKMKEAISRGGFIPKPSFNNEGNLAIWLKFHAAMGAHLKASSESRKEEQRKEESRISICIVAGDNQNYVEEFIRRIQASPEDGDTEFVLVHEDIHGEAGENWLNKIKTDWKGPIVVVSGSGAGRQAAQNLAASKATGKLLVFPDDGALLKPESLDLFRRAATHSDAAVYGCFYERFHNIEEFEAGRGIPCSTISEDFASAFFSSDYHSPVVAIRKDDFIKIGGFQEDYKIPGACAELFTRASLKNMGVETLPEPVAWVVDSLRTTVGLNFAAEPYRTIRPFLENAPHCYKRILMTARSATAMARTGPMAFIETKARELAGEAGGSPKLRNFGWSMYWLHLRIFRKIVDLEIKAFKGLLRLKSIIFRK